MTTLSFVSFFFLEIIYRCKFDRLEIHIMVILKNKNVENTDGLTQNVVAIEFHYDSVTLLLKLSCCNLIIGFARIFRLRQTRLRVASF